MDAVLRRYVEEVRADELDALAAADDGPRPPGWRLTPRAVRTFLVGGRLDDGTAIAPKFVGDPRRVEVAIAILATDRALLLEGVPGTGKSWLGEHLQAAISGDSTLVVHGPVATAEDVLGTGDVAGGSVAGTIPVAVRTGRIARVEDLDRMGPAARDALGAVLADKAIGPRGRIRAVAGFNVIATATPGEGLPPSDALRRRFATVRLAPPVDLEEEVALVRIRLEAIGRAADLPGEVPAIDAVRAVVAAFRALRSGVEGSDGDLSPGAAAGVLARGWRSAVARGGCEVGPDEVADGLVEVAGRDPRRATALRGYAAGALRRSDGAARWARAIAERV